VLRDPNAQRRSRASPSPGGAAWGGWRKPSCQADVALLDCRPAGDGNRKSQSRGGPRMDRVRIEIPHKKRYRTPCRSELLEFVEGGFQFVARTPVGEDTVKPYPGVDDLVGPAVRVRMPRAANPVPRRSSVGRRAGHA
jgi:hypothetical protein